MTDIRTSVSFLFQIQTMPCRIPIARILQLRSCRRCCVAALSGPARLARFLPHTFCLFPPLGHTFCPRLLRCLAVCFFHARSEQPRAHIDTFVHFWTSHALSERTAPACTLVDFWAAGVENARLLCSRMHSKRAFSSGCC